MSVIKGHKARELISSSLVQVSDTDTIGQVLNVLLEHKFMSVPVANPDGVVYVFVDCFDLVLFILSRVQNGDHDVYELPVSEVIETTSSQYEQVNVDDDLMEVAQKLSGLDGTLIHRVAVEEDGRIISVITQSSVVKYIARKLRDISLGNKTIKELPELGHTDVFSVDETETVQSAFEMIQEKSVSGLAVVNADGKCVGKISVNDIKLGFESRIDLFNMMNMNLVEFLQTKSEIHKLGAIHDTTKLGVIARNIARSGIHRIYVLDDSLAIHRVITLTDIIKYVVEHVE
eukprot:TRINITY_DN4822_c0_g1_i1.p1 TRINITY_DN4822_c0_g1~~TRINITY_DN4822_c0_g1_i1.p1  ORF type:complete len:288 (+),score=63.83 TRINITY_DN4822_c0_g1_i1:263-1126(+)